MRSVFIGLPLLALGAEQGAACSPNTICLSPAEAEVSQDAGARPYRIGNVVPRGEMNMVLNTEYHGLPAPDGTFWYIRSGDAIYMMSIGSREILEEVEGGRF